MVTKCDLVAGFNEFFDDLSQEGRAQVWGTTFPLEPPVRARPSEHFATEFALLLERLNARMLGGMDDRARRAAPRPHLRLSTATCRCASLAACVPERYVWVLRLRAERLAARRLLHQRHAGRHAHRSAARRARSDVRPRRERGEHPGQSGRGLLHPSACSATWCSRKAGSPESIAAWRRGRHSCRPRSTFGITLLTVLILTCVRCELWPQPRVPRRRAGGCTGARGPQASDTG